MYDDEQFRKLNEAWQQMENEDDFVDVTAPEGQEDLDGKADQAISDAIQAIKTHVGELRNIQDAIDDVNPGKSLKIDWIAYALENALEEFQGKMDEYQYERGKRL